MIHVKRGRLTLEQRDALEAQIRARTPSDPALRPALERLHQPDYGVCIECGTAPTTSGFP